MPADAARDPDFHRFGFSCIGTRVASAADSTPGIDEIFANRLNRRSAGIPQAYSPACSCRWTPSQVLDGKTGLSAAPAIKLRVSSAGNDQQQRRNRHLAGDEQVAQRPPAARSVRGRHLAAQIRDQARLGRLHARRQAGEQRRKKCRGRVNARTRPSILRSNATDIGSGR